MPRSRKQTETERRHKAQDPMERENQLIELAVDLAEQQLLDGTATPSVITHYLKLASSREQFEQERIRMQNELNQAKIEAINSQRRVEELYEEALAAMRTYSGKDAGDHE